MKALPIFAVTLMFLIAGILVADWIGLPRSGFRNLFVAVWVLCGVLVGWRIAVVNRTQQ